MKLITAIIRPEILPDVKAALMAKDVGKMTVSNVIGCGQQHGYEETYRGIKHEIKLIKKVRLDIVVSEPYLKITIDTIIETAQTGNIGDGKIWVSSVENCIRIRTGESGKIAIG